MGTINFRNNCLLCLREEEPSRILELLQKNPKNLQSFQPIVHYLTGSDPTTGQTSEVKDDIPVMKNLPPLCSSCYDICGDIYRLHVYLLEAQADIQRKVQVVRNVVNMARRGLQSQISEREKLLARLSASGMVATDLGKTYNFIKTFHGKIIHQGTNNVVFPSKPPDNMPMPTVIVPPAMIFLPRPVALPKDLQTLRQSEDFPSVPVITSVVGAALPQSTKDTNIIQTVTLASTTPAVGTTSVSACPKAPLVSSSPRRPAIFRKRSAVPGLRLPIQETSLKMSNQVASTSRKIVVSSFPEVSLSTPPIMSASVSSVPNKSQLHAMPNSRMDTSTTTIGPTSLSATNLVIIPGTSVKMEFENEGDEDDDDLLEAPSTPDPLSTVEVTMKQENIEEITLSDNEKQEKDPVGDCASESDSKQMSLNGSDEDWKMPDKEEVLVGSDSEEEISLEARFGKLFYCGVCPLRNLTPEQLRQHVPTHRNGSPGHECPNCKYTFLSASELQVHLERQSSLCSKELPNSRKLPIIKTNLKCALCPALQFSTLLQFRSHVFERHETDPSLPKNHKCSLAMFCPKFRTPHGLDFHWNVHLSPAARRRHKGRHSDCCPPPGRFGGVALRRKFVKEKKWPYPNVKFKCDVCSTSYLHTYLKQHLETKHDLPQNNILECTICGFVCTEMESYVDHFRLYLKNHSSDKPCYVCGEKFQKIGELRKHLFQKHGKGEILTCDQCGQQCLGQRAMDHHLVNDHGYSDSTE